MVITLIKLARYAVIGLLFTMTTSFAQVQTPAKTTAPVPVKKTLISTHSISGNPVSGRDNYTLNSQQDTEQDIECAFVNTADKIIKLNIWTNPETIEAQDTITLGAGSKSKPIQVMKRFLLKPQKEWWCRIYLPNNNYENWSYCTYFSIGDSEYLSLNPFASGLLSPNRSTDTSYHCRLKEPNKTSSFFSLQPTTPPPPTEPVNDQPT